MTTTKRYIPEGFIQFKPTLNGYENNFFECWVSRDDSKPIAIFYVGKSNKPLFYNRFMTLDSMKKKIIATVSNLMTRADEKAKRSAERAVPSTLKVGDVLYTSWGYDQTNINFYQVTKSIGTRSVEVQEIMSEIDHSSTGANYVVARKDIYRLDARPHTHRVSFGNQVKINSYATACLWDGKPKYETALGYGH